MWDLRSQNARIHISAVYKNAAKSNFLDLILFFRIPFPSYNFETVIPNIEA